jgi:hexosaminidase
MKRILLIATLAALASCAAEVRQRNVLDVVPYPNEVIAGEGVFDAKGAVVTYDSSLDDASVNVIRTFAQKLSAVSGVESVAAEGDAQDGFVFVYNEAVPAEAYTLNVTPEAVRVEASDLRGFNYAIQTIKQLLPVEIFGNASVSSVQWTMPCLTINDAPRFGYRGLHLDEGRHFFGVEQVKKYLDIMEVHKLNKFHWHLTEDQGWRIEIKKYPRLTEVGSIRKGTCIKKDFTSHDGVPYGEGLWYTQDQIREIIAYASAKGIDVIPEIDLPGHMLGALAAYPELGCTGGPYEVWTRWGVSEDVLCAGNEKVYDFLEDVLTEVCDLFPYEYVHIGGDECPKVRWESCPKCQAKIKALGLKDKDGQKAEHYLQSYVITRIEKFLNAKGRKVIGWDEILEGGIAPNATIMSWRGEAGGIEATRQGHDAIMTPNTYYYLDYYQSTDIANEPFGIGGNLPVEKCYSYEPYAESMTPEQTKHILGVQGNLWTEYIAEADHLFYMLLPRLAALSEVQWCNADRKDWDRFFAAADKFCRIYDVMGYNYATHILQVKGSVEAKPVEKAVVVELSAQGGAPVKYTLNGKTPGFFANTYDKPLVLTESCVLNAAAEREGVEPKVFSRKFDFHKAVGKPVTYSREPHRKYNPGSLYSLVDAVRGPEVYKSSEWVAWHGKPVDIIIDLEQTESCSSITVGMLSNKPSYIFLPQRLSVAVSEDGVEYAEVAVQDYGVEDKDAPDKASDLTLSFPAASARFVKVIVTPVQAIPDWHYAAGKRTFVFVDEIIVR